VPVPASTQTHAARLEQLAPGPLPPGPRHAVCQDRLTRAGSRCPARRYRPIPRYGHDVLASPDRGAVINYHVIWILRSAFCAHRPLERPDPIVSGTILAEEASGDRAIR